MPKPRQAIRHHRLCAGTGWLTVVAPDAAPQNGRMKAALPSHRACWCALREFQHTAGEKSVPTPFHWHQESPPGVLAAAVHQFAGWDGKHAQVDPFAQVDPWVLEPEQVQILKWYVGHFVDGLRKTMDKIEAGVGLRSLQTTVPGWLDKLDPIETEDQLRRYLIWLDVGAGIDPFKPLKE